jgi:hypothetical protein
LNHFSLWWIFNEVQGNIFSVFVHSVICRQLCNCYCKWTPRLMRCPK